MSLKLQCNCGARFLASDEFLGRTVKCPKCAAPVRVPETALVAEPAASPASFDQAADVTWQPRAAPLPPPHYPDTTRRPRRRWLIALSIALPLLFIAALFILAIRPHWFFGPKDPREIVARRYLEALERGDLAEATRLAVFDRHPAIDGFSGVALAGDDANVLAGSVDRLAAFHADAEREYVMERPGRYQKKDLLGVGLRTMDKLNEARKKAQEDGVQEKLKQLGAPGKAGDDALDAYIGMLSSIASLTDSTLNPKDAPLAPEEWTPTYLQLLDRRKPPLSSAELELAKHYGSDPEKWDRLLGRPFTTLRPEGPFQLHQAKVTALVYTAGDRGGRTITLELIRFQIGQIDTGWRVWSAP